MILPRPGPGDEQLVHFCFSTYDGNRFEILLRRVESKSLGAESKFFLGTTGLPAVITDSADQQEDKVDLGMSICLFFIFHNLWTSTGLLTGLESRTGRANIDILEG